MPAEIEHVSDTALYVAALRAAETNRLDSLIKDPFAALLAGGRGASIAESLKGNELVGFAIALRARLIDELLLNAIHSGEIQTVLNLGSGLDTRPWRLDVPAELRWVEIDFPAMLAYKSQKLSHVEPRCRVDFIPADLSDAGQRGRALQAGCDGAALMISEGLLMYLSAETLRAVASEAYSQPSFRYWLFDVASLDVMRFAHGESLDRIDQVRAPSHLQGQQILNVAHEAGWKTRQFRSLLAEARTAAGRIMEIVKAMAERNEAPPQNAGEDDVTGVWLVESQG
jgi:methyltransferase (TIGR00027 family)